MPSILLERLYRGDRTGALKLARELPNLDVFEAAALGAREQLIARAGEEAGRVRAYTDDGWTPLHLAAFFGHSACADVLLERGAIVDARAQNPSGVTPLHSACAGNHLSVAVILIAAGADVNAEQAGGHRPLDSALRSGNAELVEALRSAGALPGASDSAQAP